MHVLVISDKALPQKGGSQMVLHHLYSRMPPGSATVLTRQYPGARAFDATAGYPIHRVPFVNIPKARMPLLWLTLAARTPALLRATGADQVHCAQALETGWIGRLCKRRYGLPYVVHTYGEEIAIYSRARTTRGLLRRALTDADAVTTISRYSREQLIGLGVDPARIVLYHPAVGLPVMDDGRRAAVRSRYGLADRKVLLTVGRLVPRKGHDRVIRVLPRVLVDVPDAAYLVVGTGSERAGLERLAREAGVSDRVVFAGSVEDVAGCYLAADQFVMANRELDNGDVEGFGIVFLEANSYGLPVIGGNSGGVPDAVADGQTGWLVDPEDEEALAGAIVALLSDEDLARRMGQAGRERVECEFTWKAAAAKVWALSEQVAAGAKPGAVV